MCAVKIGWAKRDISTTEPVFINGQMYLRISEGILDPIMVTALCIDGGEGQDAAIFVSCDITGLYGGAMDFIREKLKKLTHIPVENVVVNATHTHASTAVYPSATKSPDGRDIYPSEQYREFFADKICEAVSEAWENRKEGGIAYGYGYAVVAHSRRVIYSVDQGVANPQAVAPNGFGIMYGSTKKADFSHYEAGSDHFVNLMYTVDENQKLTGMIINVPCPSQLCEHYTKLSADYWHDVRQLVTKEFGSDVFVLPQCAAAGDLSPRTMHYKEAQARRMELKYDLPYDVKEVRSNNSHEHNKVQGERSDIAERIMTCVKEVWSWAKTDIQTDPVVRHSAEKVGLTRRMITDEEKQWCEDNIRQMEALIPDPNASTPEEYRVAMSRFTSVRNRNQGALRRYEIQAEKPKIDYTIHVTRVGEIGFASNPFELYQDYMHRIQARSPFIQTFITQLAGENAGGYLATERGELNKGYSASIFCNTVGSKGGQELVEYTLNKLNELSDK